MNIAIYTYSTDSPPVTINSTSPGTFSALYSTDSPPVTINLVSPEVFSALSTYKH